MLKNKIIKKIKQYTPDKFYKFWSLYGAAKQENLFSELLTQIPFSNPNSYSLEKSLSELRSHRRSFIEKPRLVALGHNSWEKYGLYPTFARLTDFHFYQTGSVNGGWNEALRQESGKAFLAEVERLDKESPVHIVFMYCDSSFLDPVMLKALSAKGIWTVLMGLDDKHKFQQRHEFGMEIGQSTVAPLIDLYWTTWKAGLALFWQIGARPIYLAEGADPNFHQCLDLPKDIDVLFLGQKYGQRQAMVNYLRQNGIDVTTYGSGWENGFVSFEKSIELINRAKVVLGVGGVGHMLGVQHLKGRDFEVPMCGAVYLTSYNPELSDWYDIGRDILCYSSPQDCLEILKWLLPDLDKQAKIRNNAQIRSRQAHSWESRIDVFISLLTDKQ
jgi:hypothetical protein